MRALAAVDLQTAPCAAVCAGQQTPSLGLARLCAEPCAAPRRARAGWIAPLPPNASRCVSQMTTWGGYRAGNAGVGNTSYRQKTRPCLIIE